MEFGRPANLLKLAKGTDRSPVLEHPTPEEIAERSAKIRAGWSALDFRHRARHFVPTRWTPPVCEDLTDRDTSDEQEQPDESL